VVFQLARSTYSHVDFAGVGARRNRARPPFGLGSLHFTPYKKAWRAGTSFNKMYDRLATIRFFLSKAANSRLAVSRLALIELAMS
jgi:hypothetical protein